MPQVSEFNWFHSYFFLLFLLFTLFLNFPSTPPFFSSIPKFHFSFFSIVY